jgi:hypothetical protein
MDNLQTLWRSGQQVESSAPLSSAKVENIICRKSSYAFDRFCRVVYWELVLNLPLTVGIIVWLIVRGGSERLLLVPTLTVVGVGYFVWQYRFYQKMKRHQPKENVYHYLREGLVILERYVLNYKIVVGASLLLGLLLGYLTAEHFAIDPERSPFVFVKDPYQNLLLAVCIAELFIIGVFLHIKYVYQPKINQLWQLLSDLLREA